MVQLGASRTLSQSNWDQDSQGAAGSFKIVELTDLGIIDCNIIGFWTLIQAEQYIGIISAIVEQRRRLGRPIRLLIDRTQSPIFASDVVDRFSRFNRTVFRDDGRAAFVISSHVLKLQLNRSLPSETCRPFEHRDEALAWLRGIEP